MYIQKQISFGKAANKKAMAQVSKVLNEIG